MFKNITDTHNILISTTPINAITNDSQITTERTPYTDKSTIKNVYNTSTPTSITTTTVMDTITTEIPKYEQSTFTMSTVPSFENTKRPSTRKDDPFGGEFFNRSTTVRELDLDTTTQRMSIFEPLTIIEESTTPQIEIKITTEGMKEMSTVSINKVCNTVKDCSANAKCLNGQCLRICDSENSDTVCIKGISNFFCTCPLSYYTHREM